MELHNLLPDLKLFDGVTGRPATQEEDDRAERLMNALMDDARAKVDSIGAEKTKGEDCVPLLGLPRQVADEGCPTPSQHLPEPQHCLRLERRAEGRPFQLLVHIHLVLLCSGSWLSWMGWQVCILQLHHHPKSVQRNRKGCRLQACPLAMPLTQPLPTASPCQPATRSTWEPLLLTQQPPSCLTPRQASLLRLGRAAWSRTALLSCLWTLG